MTPLRLAPLLLALTLPAVAAAQWETQPRPEAAGALHAVVENPAGERLAVRRDGEDRVLATFSLGPGFDEFREDACPSFRVDDEPPVNLARQAAPCVVEGPRATFLFGRVEAGALDSPLLLQLMNGRTLTLRYPLERRGYRETRFPLEDSKQTLRDMLGPGVDVLGDTP